MTTTTINPNKRGKSKAAIERELFDNSFETWVSEHSEEQVQKLIDLHLEITRLKESDDDDEYYKGDELEEKRIHTFILRQWSSSFLGL